MTRETSLTSILFGGANIAVVYAALAKNQTLSGLFTVLAGGVISRNQLQGYFALKLMLRYSRN